MSNPKWLTNPWLRWAHTQKWRIKSTGRRRNISSATIPRSRSCTH